MFKVDELLAVLPDIGCNSLLHQDENKLIEKLNELKIYSKDFEHANEYPYLNQEPTINFIKKSKVMFIMRGLPGSGKSTLAKNIMKTYGEDKAVLCAGDLYFTDPVTKIYNFDKNKLQDAHAFAKQTAENACKNCLSPVIIDNTNVLFWEIKPYIDLAFHHNYIVILSEPQTPWKFNVSILSEKNTHQVPRETIQRRLKDFHPIIPAYFAWFLNEEDSKILTNKAFDIYGKCLKELASFTAAITKLNKTAFSNQLYFQAKKDLLHCTSKYCGRDKDTKGKNNYWNKSIVPLNLGKCSQIKIIGFTITEKTIGAQVDLNHDIDQFGLWDNDFTEEEIKSPLFKNYSIQENIEIGLRAHLTIGLAKDIKPMQTGVDQIVILSYLKNNNTKLDNNKIEIDDYNIIQVSDTRIYIKLKEPIYFDSIFTTAFR